MLPSDIFFQSPTLSSLNLYSLHKNHFIFDDDKNKVIIEEYKDEQGLIYWYRNIQTPVCLTGVCKEINVGIYWRINGAFLGYEVYGEPLTKTDHSVFQISDYLLLDTILSNNWSVLREYDFEELLVDSTASVDGVTGATRKELAEEAVQDAVYTTYTLWHKVNQGENEQLKRLSARQLNSDSSFLEILLSRGKKEDLGLIMDLFAQGELNNHRLIDGLILDNLDNSNDNSLKELSYKALVNVEFSDFNIQKELSNKFPLLKINERMRVLNSMGEDINLGKDLYQSLVKDLEDQNLWYVANVVKVIMKYPDQIEEVVNLIRGYRESDNSLLNKMANRFVQYHNIQ